MDIAHGNFTAHHDINTRYLGITQDESMAVEISPDQFSICQEANGQFCNNLTPFQPLVNLPSCITALYTKDTASISARCSLEIRKTQSISIPSQICTQCMDIYYRTLCSNYSNNPHQPRRNNKIYYSEEAISHFATTPSLQCYITQLPSTPIFMEVQLYKSIFL